MRARLLLAILPLLTLVVAPAEADRGGFAIRSLHADLEVKPNAEMIVTERIEVDFLEPRHGIYRTIPVRYTDPIGYSYSLGFRMIDVEDDAGKAHETKVTNEGAYVKIRIGSANRTVKGLVVYNIRYLVRNALRHFPEHDELYWNVTGNEWPAPIESASATLRLPGGAEFEWIELAGYTGGYGQRSREVSVTEPQPGVAGWVTTSRLAPREGLTIVATWPHGLVQFPGRATRTAWFFLDNWVLAVPFLVGFWLWRRYKQTGRDPVDAGSVVVRYEPPEGVSAGALGTVVDEKVDQRDITATVVDLAVRGYLTIEIEKDQHLFGLIESETIHFVRQREKSSEDLLIHERRILDGIFSAGDRVELSDLKNRFYKKIPAIKNALYDRVVELGLFDARPSTVRRRTIGLGVAATALTVGAGIAWAFWRGGVMPHALIVPIVAGAVTLLLFVAFAPAMPRRTRKGVELRRWALGFEEFVDRVESDKLEADRARNVFESLLPYAMALGVAAVWARRFEGIYVQGGPAWFVGHDPTVGFSTVSFEKSLTSAMTQTSQAMASAPRSSGSSGSGGGGFSGGGGGGGGGGSW
jgi:uncharacterized membrane protein